MFKEQYISNDELFLKGQQIKQSLVKQHNYNIVDIITYTLNNKTAAIQWTVMYFVWPMLLYKQFR